MSKRITTQTEITNLAIAQQALRDAGFKFSVHEERITIESGGALRGAFIDTSTGEINHDDMFNPMDAINLFKQNYAEALIRFEAAKNGYTFVGERVVHRDGTIELQYQTG